MRKSLPFSWKGVGILVACVAFVLRSQRLEGFETNVEIVNREKKVGYRNPAGCPCEEAIDCISSDCRGGLCRDHLGILPKERGELHCPRRGRNSATGYRLQGNIDPDFKEYAAVGEPGCPCAESVQCRYGRCRSGRCTNWFGFLPWEEPTGCPRLE